ncbi:unnamed protein product [Symbiodinium microadriaticum]|nr:unnamed protein product [Symbiodinium microadriaticum]CAE7270029.1 unnamed protein product [Symbiodinium sp. KB8]
MALPMKKTVMKAMKSTAMKAKAMKRTKAGDEEESRQQNRRGKLAKAAVFQGRKEKTSTGLQKMHLMKNKYGKVVSKKKHASGKQFQKLGQKWISAVMTARKELGMKGFCAVGGKSAQGKALYAKVCFYGVGEAHFEVGHPTCVTAFDDDPEIVGGVDFGPFTNGRVEKIRWHPLYDDLEARSLPPERLHWLKLRRFDVPASRAGVGVEDLVSHRPVSDRTLLAEGAGKVYILEINTSIYIHNHCGYRGADADEGLRRRLHHGSRGGFMGCSGDCVALRAQLNAVHFPATIDNGNLQTAEYIKFTAGFFNLEAAANQFFDATVAAYTANAGQSNGPKVAWIEYNSRGALPSYRVSMAAYRAQMVDAEAGRIVNGNDLLAQGMAVRDIVASNPAAGKVCILEINASEATAATVAQTLTKTYAPIPRTYTFTSFLTGFHLTEASNLKLVKAPTLVLSLLWILPKSPGQNGLALGWHLSESDGLDWFVRRPDDFQEVDIRIVAMNEANVEAAEAELYINSKIQIGQLSASQTCDELSTGPGYGWRGVEYMGCQDVSEKGNPCVGPGHGAHGSCTANLSSRLGWCLPQD